MPSGAGASIAPSSVAPAHGSLVGVRPTQHRLSAHELRSPHDDTSSSAPLADVLAPPTPPTDLQVAADGSSIVAAWTPGDSSASDGATQELTILDDHSTVVASVSLDATAASFHSDALVAGATYTVVVATVDANGTAGTTSDPVTTTFTAPLPPLLTNLAAYAGDGEVLVSWDALDPLIAAGVTAIVVTDSSGDTCAALATDTSCALSVANGVPVTIAVTVTSDGGSTTTDLPGSVVGVAASDPGTVDPSTVTVQLVNGVWVVQWVEPASLVGIAGYSVSDDQGDSCQSGTSDPGATATCVLSTDPSTVPTGIVVTADAPVDPTTIVDQTTIQVNDTGGSWVVSWIEPSTITDGGSYVVTDDAGDTCTVPVTTAGALASCVLAPDSSAQPSGVSVAVVGPIASSGCGALVGGSVICADGPTMGGGAPSPFTEKAGPTAVFDAMTRAPERWATVARVFAAQRSATHKVPAPSVIGVAPLERNHTGLVWILGSLSLLGLGLGLGLGRRRLRRR